MRRTIICLSALIFLTSALATAQAPVSPAPQVRWLDTYTRVEPFSCGYARVRQGQEQWFLDAAGTRLELDQDYIFLDDQFRNGLAAVMVAEHPEGGRMGWIGTDGALKLPMQYDSQYYNVFCKNTMPAVIQESGQLVTLDTTGKILAIAPTDMRTSSVGGLPASGLIAVELQTGKGYGPIGFADRMWNMVIPPSYRSVYWPVSGGGTIVAVEDRNDPHFYNPAYAINVAGEKITPAFYSPNQDFWGLYQYGFGCGLVSICEEYGAWGAVDTHGELVIPYQYDEAFRFSAGYALAHKYERWDIIDTDGNITASNLSIDISPDKSNLDYNFAEDLVTVSQNGKWGYMDSTGQMVIPCQFEAATPFSEGLAWVQREDGTWGILKSPLATKSPWAEEEIQSAYVHDIITERTSSRFQEPMTRLQCAELTVNLAEMLKGRPIMEAEGTRFTDTRDWMALKAAQSAIATGVGDGSTFSPKSSVTREQFAAMLCRALQYGGTALPDSPLKSFTDSTSVSPWAVNAVAALTEAGIMQGTPDGLLLPQGQITVEEGLVLTLRAYQLDDISAATAPNLSQEQ